MPRADALWSDQQQERIRRGDFLGKLGQPEACPERNRKKKTCAAGSILARPARNASATAVSVELNDRKTCIPVGDPRLHVQLDRGTRAESPRRAALRDIFLRPAGSVNETASSEQSQGKSAIIA